MATKVTVKVRNQGEKSVGVLKRAEDEAKSTTRLSGAAINVSRSNEQNRGEYKDVAIDHSPILAATSPSNVDPILIQ